MFTIYLACLIFGGILLGFSIFFGGEHSHSVSSDHDFGHGDDFSADSDSPSELEAHSGHIEHSSHSADTDGVKLISFRNLIFFLTFFGLTGTLFHLLGIFGYLTFFSALGIGAFSWLFGYKLMKYLKGSESGEAISTYDLKGHQAVVTLPLHKNRKGKILVEAQGTTQELTATISESEDYETLNVHEKILIIDIKNNEAICVKSDL